MFRRIKTGVALILLVLAHEAPVGGDTLPPVRRIRIEGAVTISSADILTALGLPPGATPDSVSLRQGVERVLRLYQDQGFFRTEIDAPTLRFVPDSSGVDLILHIREGAPAEITRIRLSDPALWSESDLLEGFDSRPGQRFQSQVLERDIDRLLSRYERNGHPYAQIDITRIDFVEGKLDIELTIREGPAIRIDGFRIIGAGATRPETLSRMFMMPPGSLFDQDKLDAGRRRLLRSGLFTSVETPTLELNRTGDGVAILLEVEEGRHNVFDGILGYTPGGPGRSGFVTGRLALEMNNIAGTARRARGSWTRRDPLSSELTLSYTEPWVFGIPLDTGMDFSQIAQDSSYTATQIGVGVIYPLGGTLDGQLRLGWRAVTPDSLNRGVIPKSREFTGRLGLALDTRDHPFNPVSGQRLALSAEYGLRFNEAFGGFLPERRTVRTGILRVDVEQHIPARRRHSLFLAVHAVEIQGGERLLPSSGQSRLGGTNSLRGYRENQFRGRRLAWANIEYRILLSSLSRFFFFLDAGYIETPQIGGVVKTTRAGYGLGLRVESGLGLLGIDYAVGQDDALLNGKIHFGFRNIF